MSNTNTPTDSPVIQPMHNPSQAAIVQRPQAPLGNSTNGLLQPPGQGAKAMLAKRLAKGGNPKYISPTDNMLTPCTAKISQSKKKHFNKGKPVQLFMKKDLSPKASDEDGTSVGSEEGVARPDALKVDDDENPF